MAPAKLMRLRRSEDFRSCYSKGRIFKSGVAVLHVLPNGLPYTRVGFSVSKRVGKAVMRNRVRRRLQAIMQDCELKPGFDVVIAARVRAKDLSFAEINQGVRSLLSKARLMVSGGDPSKGRC